MLFGSNAGHGLEPVGVVGGTLFRGPILHGLRNGVGSGKLQLCPGIDAGTPGLINLGRKPLLHGSLVEYITAENLRNVDDCVHIRKILSFCPKQEIHNQAISHSNHSMIGSGKKQALNLEKKPQKISLFCRIGRSPGGLLPGGTFSFCGNGKAFSDN